MVVSPLLITGMHRSGTSATARVLHQAGLDLGDRFLAATLDNALGYYEDLEFGALNLALMAAGIGDDPDHQPDWAFPELLVPERLAPLRPRAAALVESRHARGHAWGFKDPRTAVLLDFYDDLVPDARYLFVYRAPWDVLTSLMSAEPRRLHGRADLAVRAWVQYNSRLLGFRAAHPGRTVLVHVDALATDAEGVVELVRAQKHPEAPMLDGAVRGDGFVHRLLHHSASTSAIAELLRVHHPDALELYAELEREADLTPADPAPDRGPLVVDVETRAGPLRAAAVLVGAPADGLEAVTRIARPVDLSDPAYAADAGVASVPDDLVAVLFAGQTWGSALRTAVSSLDGDPGQDAVLLAPGPPPSVLADYDPVSEAHGGAGIVLRRAAWLAVRGFSSAPAPPGFEAWAFAVACAERGLRLARVTAAIHLPGAPADATVYRDVLRKHPDLLLQRLLAAEPHGSDDGSD